MEQLLDIPFPSLDAQRAYEDFARADRGRKEQLVARVRREPDLLRRQPLLYLLVAEHLRLPMERSARTAQMELADVLAWLQRPIAEETEAALLQRLFEFLFPRVEQFDAGDRRVLGYAELLRVENMQVLDQLEGGLRLERAAAGAYFRYSVDGARVRVTTLQERRGVSVFRRERLALFSFADGAVFGLRLPPEVDPVKTVRPDVVVLGRE